MCKVENPVSPAGDGIIVREAEREELRADVSLGQRDAEIENLQQTIAELSEVQRRLTSELQARTDCLTAVYSSTSWRITAPLRSIALIARQTMDCLHGARRNFFSKRKVKDSLFIKREGSSTYVPLINAEPPTELAAKVVAFYLPQFHQVPENDAFWGAGFTEWVHVKAAKPQFRGHRQPRVPGELGYYDLATVEIQRRQVELAKLYGVSAFCFYFYWFDGLRPLEKPLNNYLRDPSLDLPFCLCWANENWTRRWDGRDADVLLSQKHSPDDDLKFIEHLSRYFSDSRYIRINGKPLIIVYRPSLLPSAYETSERWRTWCRAHGVGEIYLAYTQSFERVVPSLYGFDAAIEFPPNMEAKRGELPNLRHRIRPMHDDFGCSVLDWTELVSKSNQYTDAGYKLFRGVCPGWDNTPRRKNHSRILVCNSPPAFQSWVKNAIADTLNRFKDSDERLVFVNAWNEWGEGAHLEPDHETGYAYLEAVRSALSEFSKSARITPS